MEALITDHITDSTELLSNKRLFLYGILNELITEHHWDQKN